MKGASPSPAIRAVAGYYSWVPRWDVRTLINSLVVWKGKSMSIVTIDSDLSNNVVAVLGMDATRKPALSRSL